MPYNRCRSRMMPNNRSYSMSLIKSYKNQLAINKLYRNNLIRFAASLILLSQLTLTSCTSTTVLTKPRLAPVPMEMKSPCPSPENLPDNASIDEFYDVSANLREDYITCSQRQAFLVKYLNGLTP